MKTVFVLTASMLLWTGCCRTGGVIPDGKVPHQVSDETCVQVWARNADGKLERVKVTVPAGWWVAGPQVVE